MSTPSDLAGMLVLGVLTLLLLVGGGVAAARFGSTPRGDEVIAGSFSTVRRADYSSGGEQPIAPQRAAVTPVPVRVP